MQKMTPTRHHQRLAFSLVELIAVVAVLGCVLAVFVPAYVRSVRSSRSAEAAHHLSWLYKNTSAYFQRTHHIMQQDYAFQYCLPDSAGPTPALLAPKGQAQLFVKDKASAALTWRMLGFLPKKVYFQYQLIVPKESVCYNAQEHTIGEQTLTFRARADLDGDGVRSTYERFANIDAQGLWHHDVALHVEKGNE